MTRPCGHSDCAVSTGIHEGLTFGRGNLSDNGFWAIPCEHCARVHEASHPEDGPCWPFAATSIVDASATHRWTTHVKGHLEAQYTGDVLPRGVKRVAVHVYTCECGATRDRPPPPIWEQTPCPLRSKENQ